MHKPTHTFNNIAKHEPLKLPEQKVQNAIFFYVLKIPNIG